MKINKETQKNELHRKGKALQNNAGNSSAQENGSAQKDGFRYDYNDNF